MVGANHEMNRELLWRRYPTDRRGTPFRRFWDRVDGKAPDIGPIHEFRPNAAARHATPAPTCAARWSCWCAASCCAATPTPSCTPPPPLPNGSFDPAPAVVEDPIFWGRIAPDVTFVGFDLVREDVEPAPGWYFVHRRAADRAALRARRAHRRQRRPPATWTDLHWGHVGVDPGEHLSHRRQRAASTSNVPLVTGRAVGRRFGRNSADMAAITFQRPFRAVVHTSEVLDGAGRHGPRRRCDRSCPKSVLLRRSRSSGGGG